MFKKKYGQNFLNNSLIGNKIVNSLTITGKNILEIGCGNLALTNKIINKKPKKFICIEIDKDLIDEMQNSKNSKYILEQDALIFNEIKAFQNQSFSIISNLPFNISSLLLIKWINIQSNYNCINEMVLMFQKELAERIISKENTKKYGRISLLSQAYFNVKKELIVKKAEFTPVPKVDAIVLKFTPLERKKIKVSNIKNLEKLSNFFFNDRRKKNKKKIKSLFSDEQITKNKYEKYFDLRPENLNKEIFYEMSNLLLD